MADHGTDTASRGGIIARCLIRLVVAFCICLIAFTALKAAASAIPPSLMEENISTSSKALLEEGGNYYYMFGNDLTTMVDNYCLAVSLSISSHGQGLFDAFNDAMFVLPDNPGVTSLAASVGVPLDSIDTESGYWEPYPRYWHGYTVLIRPLLCFFDINQIRMILGVVVSLLLLVMVARLTLIRKWGGVAFALPFFIMHIFVVVTTVSYAASFVIALIFSHVIMHRLSNQNGGVDGNRLFDYPYWTAAFFVVGGLTSYFDFLGTPIVSFGVPLALLVFLCSDSIKQSLMKKAFIACVVFLVCWCVGYGLLWASKWLVSSLITGQNVLADAVGMVTRRVGSEETMQEFYPYMVGAPFYDALLRNAQLFFSRRSIVLILALFLVAAIVCRIRGNSICKANWRAVVLLLVIGLLPYAWYLIVFNHSWIHIWFTYRDQVISLCCLFFVFDLLFMERACYKGKDNDKSLTARKLHG